MGMCLNPNPARTNCVNPNGSGSAYKNVARHLCSWGTGNVPLKLLPSSWPQEVLDGKCNLHNCVLTALSLTKP